MNYSILVLDLDGTLTNSEKKVTERTKRAIRDYQDRGGLVVLASGRPLQGILPVAKALSLAERGGYILSFNGGMITDCKTDEVLFRQTLPPETVPVLHRLSKELGAEILTYEGDHIITETPEDEYVRLEAKINGVPVRQVEDFAEHIDFPITKCLMVGEDAHMAQVEQTVKAELEGKISAYRSAPFFLECMPLGIDKANSIDWLAHRLGRGQQDVIAFGDGFNDCSMIDYAAMGVAMENAQEEVKAVADYITKNNDEDGVAYGLEQLIRM